MSRRSQGIRVEDDVACGFRDDDARERERGRTRSDGDRETVSAEAKP
jgi:hypothetical protein